MPGKSLAVALAAIAAGRTALLLRAVGDDEHKAEENTYGLPLGEPIAAELRNQYERIARDLLGELPTFGDELPQTLPNLGHYAPGMAEPIVPLLSVYWDESGRRVNERLGLDPDDWQVTNPHLQAQIHQQALDFCQSTLSTTSNDIHDALERLRGDLVKGLVEKGDTLPQLAKRVKAIFEEMQDWKAAQIAATEASRAVHAAQLTADQESGVVAGLELLLSSDACALCRKVATEAKRVRLGQAFAVIGHNPHYAAIKHPPLHPHCQCAMIEVLMPEFGGPANPEWSEPLQQPQKGLGDTYKPPKGVLVPEPKPQKLEKPLLKPVAPAQVEAPEPKPKSTQVGAALDVEVKGRLGHNLKGAIDAIDEVHGDGVLPKIPVKEGTADAHGQGEFGWVETGKGKGRAVHIGISAKTERPDLTLVHEVGHFIDGFGIPQPKGATGLNRDYAHDPHLSDWFKAVMDSASVKALKKIEGQTEVPFTTAKGQAATLQFDGGYVSYLLRPKELWARSYAQYVATRGHDGALKSQLDKVLGWDHAKECPQQWTHEAFEPIAQEIDSLFTKLGWLPPPANPYK